MFLKGAGYEAAKLENGAWHFQGLISNNNNADSTENKIEEESPFSEDDDDSWAFSLNQGELLLSTTDANVTVINYDFITPMVHSGWFNYSVQGKGTQTLNFFYVDDPLPFSWNVEIDGKNKPENEGWTIAEDGKLTIAGAESNVAIRYEQLQPPHETPPLPWTFTEYLIFSIAVGSAIAISITVTILFLYGRRVQKQKEGEEDSAGDDSQACSEEEG